MKFTCPPGNVHKLTKKTSTALSLTVTLSVVEECHQSNFIEFGPKLIDIGPPGSGYDY